MKKIPLTKGKFALIDDDDFDIVNKGKWSVLFNGFNWYAYRRVGKNSDMLYLHRYIYETLQSQSKHGE